MKDKPVKSNIQAGENYNKEHLVLMSIYEMYQSSALLDDLSFSQYFDCIMKLDSARASHEVHNYLKAEHNMNENFIFGNREEDEEL